MTTLSKDQVQQLVLDICKDNPERVNPHDGNFCLYDDGNGNHCVVGQLAVNQGWRVLGGKNPWASSVAYDWDWPLDPDAAHWLDEVQSFADNVTYHGGGRKRLEPRTWREVAQAIENGAI